MRNYKKGQEVEAIVLAVDVDRERISLGIKQLDSDPFTTYTSINDRGAAVTGKVKMVDACGAEIELNADVTGYLRASEISRDRVEDARNVLKEGDEVSAVILAVDRKTRSIQLSIKAKDNVDNQEAMQRLAQTSERENAGAGGLFVALAVAFCWYDLHLSTQYLLAVGGGLTLALTVAARNEGTKVLVSIAIGALVMAGVVWHALTVALPLTIGLLVVGAAGIVHVATTPAQRHAWLAGATAALGASWAAYYRFATLGFAAESTSRRLVITLAWLLGGLVGMVLGTRKDERGMRDAGALVVVVAIVKALSYDTTHLAGVARVGLCALAGVALIVGALIVKPREAVTHA